MADRRPLRLQISLKSTSDLLWNAVVGLELLEWSVTDPDQSFDESNRKGRCVYIMRVFSSSAVAVMFCILLTACEFSFSINSSDSGNDYFEEPLSELAEKYDPALRTSNRFVRGIKESQMNEVYETFTDALQKVTSPEDFRVLYDQLTNSAGQVSEFLPQQWAFKTGTVDGVDVIYSAKIVIHENDEYFYVFVFLDDGKYDKINGFRIQPRYADEDVIAGIERIFDSGS